MPDDEPTSASMTCPVPSVEYEHVLLGHGSGGS